MNELGYVKLAKLVKFSEAGESQSKHSEYRI